MKENIYTIPINDAFSSDCECPLCNFKSAEENNRIEYALGASMMEPDERIASNEQGYCQRHTQMMYNFGNKLSHALVLETRLKYITAEIEKYQPKKLKKLFAKGDASEKFSNSETCIVCSRLNVIMENFISNLFYLYKKDQDFKKKFFECKGFCLPHFELLLNSAPKYLSGEVLTEFFKKTCELQKTNLERVTEDIVWFTKKFDYRYKDEDWKNSKDAVNRACLKISGYIEE